MQPRTPQEFRRCCKIVFFFTLEGIYDWANFRDRRQNKNLVNQSTNTTFLVDKETNLCVLGKFPKNEKIIESKTDHQRNQNEKIQNQKQLHHNLQPTALNL